MVFPCGLILLLCCVVLWSFLHYVMSKEGLFGLGFAAYFYVLGDSSIFYFGSMCV